ncbi:two-component system sensor histidine kinase NtrB [Litorimonas sp. RW-G-Af-16]|uniref:two-component system sensor histidine kinase NtrB n=1 Tax=Litorimonas sp. RW-G-Af-16 TaxID=3241168 RepID=UPI00390CD908
MNIMSLSEDWPFPLVLLDQETATIRWVNMAAQEWLGQSLRNLEGKSPWDMVEVSDATQKIVSKCQESGASLIMRDCPIKRHGKEEEFCHITAYPTEIGIGLSLWTAGPRPRGSRVGGQVVSGMGRMIAHELKNPLAGIKGAAQLLRDDVESEEGRSLLDLISSEIDRIRRLADRMETLGDVDPTNRDRVNIHELLRQARRIIQSANPNLIFTERYDPSLPHVVGDADTLMQALLNLIKNASEAIEKQSENGEIILETRFRVGVRNGDDDQAKNLPIEILIIDNGPGVKAAMKEQLFQPFVTSKPEGQGLGLALVSKVARAHGGIVEVTSRPGRTKFSLLLPAPNGDPDEV